MPVDTFKNHLCLMEQAYVAAMVAFVEWLEENWELGTRADWEKTNAEPWPGDEYKRGWDEAIGSIRGAYETFAEENM